MQAKTLTAFLIILLALAGCKKSACYGVICASGGVCENGECNYAYVCGVNQHSENGTCVCDTGWYGWHCDKKCDDCGPHYHCVENWCICDSGWSGNKCSIYIGAFVGSYHVSGQSTSWMLNTPSPPPTYIDDTIVVILHKDSLIVYGHGYVLLENSPDSLMFFSFSNPGASYSYYSGLKFHKNGDDSLFYYNGHSGLGSGYDTRLSGKRIN